MRRLAPLFSPTSSVHSSSIHYIISLTRPLSSSSAPITRTEDIVQPGDAAAFKRVVLARNACKSFQKGVPIPEETLKDILALMLRSPSSHNLQPYVAIVVDEELSRNKLSSAMLDSNVTTVATAPVSIVFAVDTDPVLLLPSLLKVEGEAGKPVGALEHMRSSIAALFATGGPCRSPSTSPINTLLQATKTALTQAVSSVAPMITVPDHRSWPLLSTGIALQALLHAAAAHGVSSCPMEGFDARRVCAAVALPSERYTPVAVCALGYSAAGRFKSPRYPPQDVVKRNTHGVPFTGIERL